MVESTPLSFPGSGSLRAVHSLVPPEQSVLVVDDEPALRETLEILLGRQGYRVVTSPGCNRAIEELNGSPQAYPLVLTDLSMPDGSGLDVLCAAKARNAATEVILLTAHHTVANAVEAMGAGAFNFITKPFVNSELLDQVSSALEKRARRVSAESGSAVGKSSALSDSTLIGDSAAMRRVVEVIRRIAPMRTTVLITGESGTGKERVARAIHANSDRSERPCLVVNCGALPEALMESELFGHERGAFTGAHQRHQGIFREANGGTVMLDEVGELSLPLQVKLLRVLQERAVKPVGASQEVPVDVRVLAATNRDVEAEVAAGRFRQDLYYRLNVIRVELPPLRQRAADIPLLAERFLRRFAREMSKDMRGFTPEALRALGRYEFPGNVRELENLVERAVALSGSNSIGLGDMPQALGGDADGYGLPGPELPLEGCELDVVLGQLERRLLLAALERTGGVRKAAAELLGITFRSLRYRLQKHALADSEETDSEPGCSAPGASS